MYCRAIHPGPRDEHVTKRISGAICHSRRVTAANRILRLYVSIETPYENLLVLASLF